MMPENLRESFSSGGEKIINDLIELINYAMFIYARLNDDSPLSALVQAGETYINRKNEYKEIWQLKDIEELIARLRLKAEHINAIWRENKNYHNNK